jgi:hypothetical protein
MAIFEGKFTFYLYTQMVIFRPERPEYFSPGHSFRRNDRNDAPGKNEKIKTVREGKMIKTIKIFRTELLNRIAIGTEIHPFRPKLPLLFMKRYHADDFNCLHPTPGDARGYYNFSLSGKRKIYPLQTS